MRGILNKLLVASSYTSHSTMSRATLKHYHLRILSYSDTIHWGYSFKLFVYFSRLSGIEIARLKNVSKLYRYSLLIYAVTNWLANVIGNKSCVFLMYDKYVRPNSNHLTASNATDKAGGNFVVVGNVVMEVVFSSLLATGVHGWLIAKSQQEDWAVLWTKLAGLAITKVSVLRRRIKSMAYVGCLILIAVVIVLKY